MVLNRLRCSPLFLGGSDRIPDFYSMIQLDKCSDWLGRGFKIFENYIEIHVQLVHLYLSFECKQRNPYLKGSDILVILGIQMTATSLQIKGFTVLIITMRGPSPYLNLTSISPLPQPLPQPLLLTPVPKHPVINFSKKIKLKKELRVSKMEGSIFFFFQHIRLRIQRIKTLRKFNRKKSQYLISFKNYKRTFGHELTLSHFLSGADFAQIRKSIELISKVFPEIFSNQIIDKLYLALFRKFSKSQAQQGLTPCFQGLTDPAGSISQENGVKTEYQSPSQYEAITETQNHFSRNNNRTNSQIYFSDEEGNENKNKVPSRSRTTPQKALKNSIQKKGNGSAKKCLKEIWNEDLQRQFIELFRARKPFVHIRNYFIDKYPQYKPYFQYYQLRSQSYKIMRIALRKLYFFIQSHGNGGLPEIEKTTQTRSNCMYYHKEGYEIRLLLVELYLMKEYDQRFCTHLIKAINAFFRKVDPECNEESIRKLKRLQNQAAKFQFTAGQTSKSSMNFPNAQEQYDFGQNYQ